MATHTSNVVSTVNLPEYSYMAKQTSSVFSTVNLPHQDVVKQILLSRLGQGRLSVRSGCNIYILLNRSSH